MNPSRRRVEPEELDGLAADDPRGRRSRRDLRRVHVAMRSVSNLQRAVAVLQLVVQPRRILELGAGDGTLLLRFARAQRPRWNDVELTLLDRVDLVSEQTHAGYRELGWQVRFLRADALEWAASRQTRSYDLCFANLFLHHFEPAPLILLLRAVAAATDAFVACEPRRSKIASMGSRLIVLLGASAVTRQDAVKSVAAGFTDRELSAAWNTAGGDWNLVEFPAPPFSHCLAAARAKSRRRTGEPQRSLHEL
jgi:SAM-dependent methyltransferase